MHEDRLERGVTWVTTGLDYEVKGPAIGLQIETEDEENFCGVGSLPVLLFLGECWAYSLADMDGLVCTVVEHDAMTLDQQERMDRKGNSLLKRTLEA